MMIKCLASHDSTNLIMLYIHGDIDAKLLILIHIYKIID